MSLRVEDLDCSLGQRKVLQGINLQVADQQVVCVVGPSGSGKSTLLRVVAGLERPDRGRVLLDGHDVTTTPPERRPTSMVFQTDALFPALTVQENVAFGLDRRRMSAERREEAVAIALLRMGLRGLEHCYPERLSGGQQRRVSIARALVTNPRVLLLDEPMAGLDEPLRMQLSAELTRLPRRQRLSLLHVTHDQSEALATADVLVVLAEGRILQQASPREVFRRPDCARVASFLGRSNFLDVDLVRTTGAPGAGRALVRTLGDVREVPCHDSLLGSPPGRATLMVRPHAVSLAPAAVPAHHGDVHGAVGIVQRQLYRGDRCDHVVETERGTVVVSCPLDEVHRVGDQVELTLDADQVWLLPREG